MHPTDEELREFHWHCAVVRSTGAIVTAKTKKDIFGFAVNVIVLMGNKSYRFSDPDWNVITKQLATLVTTQVLS